LAHFLGRRLLLSRLSCWEVLGKRETGDGKRPGAGDGRRETGSGLTAGTPSMRVVLSSRRTCTCTELPRAMAARALLLRRFRPRVHNQTRGCDRGGSSLSPPTPSGNGALPSIRARRSRLTAAGTPYPAYAHRAAEPEDGTPSQNRGSQNRGSPGALVPGPPVVPRARPPSVSHPRPSLPPICPPSAFASLP
jgi:hypothetical protein